MEKTEIREKVQIEINKWTKLQEKRQINISFTTKAIDFLCLMIENIKDDKSQFWHSMDLESDVLQELAISLIPNALNELPYRGKYRNFYFSQKKDIRISTWEIWHSLSQILDRFCFVPKSV